MRQVIEVGHLARVEGHGGITVELEGDTVSRVELGIFEGIRLIETLVRGRGFHEIAQISSRICSICSAAHTLTALKAMEGAFGLEVSPQTRLLRELLFRGESIASHALHLFLLALPDYLERPSVLAIAADRPETMELGLRLKKVGNGIQETIGGRAIHPVNALLGGFGRVPSVDELVALRNDLERALDDCDAMIDLLAALPAADDCRAETTFAALRLPPSYDYHLGDTVVVLADGKRQEVPVTDYRDLTHEVAVAHSHAKHSTFEGQPFMVGALARLSVNTGYWSARGERAVERLGLELPSGNPMDNNKAQAVELVMDTERALQAVERLLREGPVEERPLPVRPQAGTGTAATEAPRGLLVHSYSFDAGGKVTAADVITPTAINAASIERHFRHVVEQSAERALPALKRKLERVARAYDPCISCSVHLVRKRRKD